jgi:hypothetical protein
MTWQKIGAAFLALAFVLFLIRETGYAYGALLVAGVIDIPLWRLDKRTISQWIQDITENKVMDYTVLGVLLAATIYKIFENVSFVTGATICLPMLIAFLALHLFGNKD